MKIAFIRGSHLNPFESQYLEPLRSRFDITGFTTRHPVFDQQPVPAPLKKLRSPRCFLNRLPSAIQRGEAWGAHYIWGGLGEWLFGLEETLQDYDIAHVAETYNGYSYQAVRSKAITDCRVVVTVWENIPFNFETSPITRKLKETVRKGADHFIAVTQRAADALQLEGISPKRITVIPAGVNIDRFKPGDKDPDLLHDLGLSDNELIILFVGRFVKDKGVYDLLHAMRLLQDKFASKHNSLRCLLVGSGSETAGLRRRIHRLGLETTVHIHPPIPYTEMPRLHRLADIFVLPSRFSRVWQEQFGMVLIESMASAKAVVSTMSGSIPEVIGDAGLLVQPGDPRSLSEALGQLVESPALRRDLGMRGRERVENLFDAQVVAQRIGEVYTTLAQ